MSELRIVSSYDPTRIPSQTAFRRSKALIRAYGGAAGGGKSRALCEEVFDWMLDHPGITIPIFRKVHTDIVGSTRKTFIEQVLPSELRGRKDLVRIVQSQGRDFIELLWNGATVHFVGLDRGDRWLSTELGACAFDEAQEIDEDKVRLLNSRLRQRCAACTKDGVTDCFHMPHRMILTFNPSYPGHWLQEWFIFGAERTEHGRYKQHLIVEEGSEPIGDAEFFEAFASQNPFLPSDYVRARLGSMSKREIARYRDGQWVHLHGSTFFDADALSALDLDAAEFKPVMAAGEPAGSPDGKDRLKGPKLVESHGGRMEVYRRPVRWHTTPRGDEVKAHRYVVAVDASSGASADYSAIQVIDCDELEQVAEWQGKVDPDKLAETAFLTAAVYNGAVLAPEITGGWGFSVVKRCQRFIAEWKGPASHKPSIYTRPIQDRLSQKFTDLIGWDTNTKTRAIMLDTLEESLRDGSLTVHGRRTLQELGAFAVPERIGGVGDYRSPRAQRGAHDDLVVALAIGVTLAARMPKPRRMQGPPPRPEYAITGY